MKKIFSIISACLCTVVFVFVMVISLVKVHIFLDIGEPSVIYLYNKSTVSVDSQGFKAGSENFEKIMDAIYDSTNISVLNRIVNKTSLKPKLKLDTEKKYSNYSSEMKMANYAVELLFDKQQDLVVYSGEETRVLSIFAMMLIYVPDQSFGDVIIYYSATNSSDKKDSNYTANTPLYVKANSNKIQKVL